MSDVKTVFIPNTAGQPRGNYEMFIDFDSSSGDSKLTFDVPAGWSTVWIKIYPAQYSGTKVKKNSAKVSETGQLNSGQLSKYEQVFGKKTSLNPLPAGFSFTAGAGAGVLSMTSAATGEFEFVVWITDGTVNDYLDPGIKNHI